MNNLITKKVPLLDENGNVATPGYATEMVFDYDRSAIKTSSLRIKEWDYYLVYNQHFAVALTVADNGYMGLISASVIDFDAKVERTVSPMTFMPKGKTNLPATSKSGDTNIKNKRVDFCFENHDGERKLRASMKKFDGKDDFYAEFVLTDEPKESMVIATPFDKPKHFYLNQKIVGFRARGFAKVGERQINFDEDTFALLDWGRGVWTYKNTWYWSSACGVLDGEVFGFNLGYGFGNTTAATENMVFYKGKAHKLDKVMFEIPSAGRKLDFMSKWKFSSNDDRLNLDFEPIIDRHSNANALVIKSNQHQVFGRFSGTITLDNGEQIVLKDFLGFAEKVDNKW